MQSSGPIQRNRGRHNLQTQEQRAPSEVRSGLMARGTPLSDEIREFMEPRFHADFSQVRIHTDSRAAQSVQSLDANAYTFGNQIAFDTGKFLPGSREGRELLAHELSHVVQQQSGGGASTEAGLEREADDVARAMGEGGTSAMVRGRSGPQVMCAPKDSNESEDERKKRRKKLREDDVDRSFLGIEGDKHEPATEIVNKPISTAVDSTQAFKLNMAQRGFDYVGDLRLSLMNQRKEADALSTEMDATTDDVKRAELKKKVERAKGSIRRNEEKLALVSTPHLKNPEPLIVERDALVKQLEGKLTTARRSRVEKKVASLNEQIQAVAVAKAKPDEVAPLAAYKGTPLGNPKLHTFVTVQVQTADGRVLLFQARNVPGGDHAEDVVLRQLESSGLTKAKGLTGAKMVIFGDQEVCERCQKRVPEFAEKFGIHEVDGYTTHAPALKRDGSGLAEGETVKAKGTMLEVSNPDQLKKREDAQRAAGVIEKDEPLKLTQRKTFSWRKEGVPVDHPSQPAHPQSSNSEESTGTGGDIGKSLSPKADPKVAKLTNAEGGSHDVKPGSTAPKKEGQKEPSSTGASSHAATSALNKADMALSAIRDYQRYKQEYLQNGESTASAEVKAAARAGLTLSANARGGGLAAVVNAANAFDAATKSGQSKGEALATTVGTVGGGLIANKIAPTGPAGAAVQVINTAAQVLGAPQQVQDATYVAAELVPSSIISTTIVAGARSWHALGKAASGDFKSIDRLGDDMRAGNLSPWLQGYAQSAGLIADLASGDDFTKALDKAAKSGKGSWADRVGGGLADQASALGENKEAIGGKYGPQVASLASGLSIAAGLARGESFSQAYAHTHKDSEEGQAAMRASSKLRTDALKKAVVAKVAVLKNEAAATLSKAGEVVSSTTHEIKAAIAPKLVELKREVEVVTDKVVTGASDLAHKAGAAVDRGIDTGRKFVGAKVAGATDLAKRSWHRLWGE